MTYIDKLLNRITMYRLLLYVLLGYLFVGMVLAFMGKLGFSGWSVIYSAVILIYGSWLVNRIFAWAYNAPAHSMSAYITGLILALIITPIRTSADLPFYVWAPVLAITSKYILSLHKQHIFNPAAFAVALTSMTISHSASWWVGNVWMLPFVAIGGYLIVRKIRRWDVVLPFLFGAAAMVTVLTIVRHGSLMTTWRLFILHAPIFFFATIMLIEPSTMPPTKKLRVSYGLLIGLLFAPQIHIGTLYSTPELTLLAGNFVFFILARRVRYTLRLVKKVQLSPTIYDFVFASDAPVRFRPGQYLEWMMPHRKSDQRGLRRYFTIASSPTEKEVHLGVKFYQSPSSYKSSLLQLRPGQSIVAGQLDGDFTLPADINKPLVFIAGGIGVTPFRSMIKFLLDRQQSRTITMFYAVQSTADIVYSDIFEQAGAELGLRTVYVLGDTKKVPPDWHGETGYITADMIQRQVPDYPARTFYISGPQMMVESYKKVLHSLGLPNAQIKTDYFPGFA